MKLELFDPKVHAIRKAAGPWIELIILEGGHRVVTGKQIIEEKTDRCLGVVEIHFEGKRQLLGFAKSFRRALDKFIEEESSS